VADPFESVAVDCQLEMVFKLLGVHGLGRGLEFRDGVVLLDQIDYSFKLDSCALAVFRIDKRDRKKKRASLFT